MLDTDDEARNGARGFPQQADTPKKFATLVTKLVAKFPKMIKLVKDPQMAPFENPESTQPRALSPTKLISFRVKNLPNKISLPQNSQAYFEDMMRDSKSGKDFEKKAPKTVVDEPEDDDADIVDLDAASEL